MGWNQKNTLPGELAALSLRFSAAPKRSRKGLVVLEDGL